MAFDDMAITGSTLRGISNEGNDFVINRNDYLVVKKLLIDTMALEENKLPFAALEHVRSAVSIQEDDDGERRVCGIRIPLACDDSLRSLSPYITKLTRLESLEIRCHTRLTELPHDIGALTNLKALRVFGGFNLRSLPPSITKLAALERLSLELNAVRIVELPEDIGALTNLKELNLYGCRSLRSLPPSITELAGLERLHLNVLCVDFGELPEGIGALTNLKELTLDGCRSLRSLPPSITELVGLENLQLHCPELVELPKNIGALKNLETLSVISSNIEFFPPAIRSLTNLKHILCDPRRMTQFDQDGFLLGLLEDLPMLVYLGHASLKDSLLEEKIRCILALRRARLRLGPVNGIDSILPGLWPLVLSKASRAFALENPIYAFQSEVSPLPMPNPDAIYQLLVDGREILSRGALAL